MLELAKDADADVRYCMAENPALPAKILLQLQEDENVYVRARAQATLARRNGGHVISMTPRGERKAI